MAPGTLTLRDAAERLGVHYMTVYRYVRTGRLPATRVGTEWRVRADDVARLRRTPRARASQPTRSAARVRLERRLLAGDEAGAWATIEQAMASGATPDEVYLRLLAPSLESIGTQWHDGSLTIADEHRATAVAQRLVGRMGPRFRRPGRTRGTVVLGAVAGETHALPGAILADLLRGRGFDVVDLGADTPPESFLETARAASRLVAVVVGAMSPGHERDLRTAVALLRAGGVEAPILVGGPVVRDDAHARRLGADGWTGRDGHHACDAVDAVAGTPHG